MAVLQALNVPKDNVTTAIKRGVEAKAGANLEVSEMGVDLQLAQNGVIAERPFIASLPLPPPAHFVMSIRLYHMRVMALARWPW